MEIITDTINFIDERQIFLIKQALREKIKSLQIRGKRQKGILKFSFQHTETEYKNLFKILFKEPV